MHKFDRIFTRKEGVVDLSKGHLIKFGNPNRDYVIERKNRKDESYLAVSKIDNMMYTMKSVKVPSFNQV